MECERCGEWVVYAGRGQRPRFCSTRCRVRAHRAKRSMPVELTGRKSWTRADRKRPVRPDGRPASSTDPATWASFAEVQSGKGDGFGIMLGSGLGCYDLDHVSDDEIRDFVDRVREPIVFVERSVSGEGAHVFVSVPESRGWRRNGVEFYSRARFIRVTGVRFAQGGRRG